MAEEQADEEQRLAVEKLRGWGQWASLEILNPQTRFALVESEKQYHTFGLYLRLLEASRPLMKAWGLHRYALAAWEVFQQALAQHQAGDIFRRINEYYRRHWAQPAIFQ